MTTYQKKVGLFAFISLLFGEYFISGRSILGASALGTFLYFQFFTNLKNYARALFVGVLVLGIGVPLLSAWEALFLFFVPSYWNKDKNYENFHRIGIGLFHLWTGLYVLFFGGQSFLGLILLSSSIVYYILKKNRQIAFWAVYSSQVAISLLEISSITHLLLVGVVFWFSYRKKAKHYKSKLAFVFFDDRSKVSGFLADFLFEENHPKDFKFGPLNSLTAKELNLSGDDFFVYAQKGEVFYGEEAFLKSLTHISPLWYVLYPLKFVPASLLKKISNQIEKLPRKRNNRVSSLDINSERILP